MIHNTTITTITHSSIISLVCVAVLALLMAMMMIIIIASLTPLQALAQSDATTIGSSSSSQAANNNFSFTTATTTITNTTNSSTVFEERQQNDSADLTFRDLFARVNSSVVQITSSGISNYSLPIPPPDGDGTAIGSGFVIDREGHVATNDHVIANARNVSVAFSDGSVYTAKVIGSDVFADTAVLELQNVPAEKLVPLPLGNSSNLAVGEEVAAIGNPFGLTGSMSTGVVSGLGRLIPSLDIPPDNNDTNNNDTNNDDNITTIIGAFSLPNIIQTDAAINPGNSGGPLLNLKGEVIGMNTAILSESGASSGVGFAVPSDTLRVILPALIANGSYVHPWIGVSGADVTPEIAIELGLKEARGFLVIDIVMGSPADRAGIRGGDMPVAIGAIAGFQGGQGPTTTSNLLELGGDIILGVDNQTVNKIDDLLSYIESKKKAGDTVTFMVLRDGEMMSIDLVLGARPSLPPYRTG
jgi:S1-C subfamily serine protease